MEESESGGGIRKSAGIHTCLLCNYTTGYKNDYARHLMSNKHKKREQEKKTIENEEEFRCEICQYSTINKYLYQKHLSSTRHKNRVYYSEHKIHQNQCEGCRRVYSSRKNLWRHKKKCAGKEELGVDSEGSDSDTEVDNENACDYYDEEGEESATDEDWEKTKKRRGAKPVVTPDLLLEIIKQNKELQTLLVEQQKYVVNNVGNTTINTNSNNTTNKTFSIQFFLNEHCKNAIDIKDFVNSLDYSTKNLEETMKLGYVGGISKMMTDKIRVTPVEQRPLHCCDEKREKLYIKNNGEWITGVDSREMLHSIIADIANNNYRTFQQWVRENPSCMTLDTPAYEKYMTIYQGVIGSRTDEEEIKHVKRILNNIIQNIVIEKDRFLSS
jgi:Zinc-finger of C2H2 type